MDSTDLNSPDSRLEAFLRKPGPPLTDDGFSARALTALPSPRNRLRGIRASFCIGGALVGTCIALGFSGVDRAHIQEAWTGLATVEALLGTFITLGSVWYALNSNSNRRVPH